MAASSASTTPLWHPLDSLMVEEAADSLNGLSWHGSPFLSALLCNPSAAGIRVPSLNVTEALGDGTCDSGELMTGLWQQDPHFLSGAWASIDPVSNLF